MTPVLEIARLRKNYQALRPLRIAALTVPPSERVTVGGLDVPAAELLVNLITGATLPDEGEVRIFGQSTAAIEDGEAWLASLERFGIASPRGVLLEASSLQQNLAMPFTLEIDPVSPKTAASVAALATECGIGGEWLERPAAELTPDLRARVHLARAVALEPALLLVEHPTADVPEPARRGLAADLARICDRRRLAAVIVTNDDEFARAAASRNLKLDGASGELKPLKRGWLR